MEAPDQSVRGRIMQIVSWDDERIREIVGDQAGAYEFDEEEQEVFVSLEASMDHTVRALTWLAASELFLTVVQYTTTGGVASVASLADGVCAALNAAFIAMGAHSFQKVYTTRGQDVQHLLEGVIHLKHVFQNIAILSVAFGLLHISAATTLWADTPVFIAASAVGLTLARIVLFKHPELFEAAMDLPHHIHDAIYNTPRQILAFKIGVLAAVWRLVSGAFALLCGPLLQGVKPVNRTAEHVNTIDEDDIAAAGDVADAVIMTNGNGAAVAPSSALSRAPFIFSVSQRQVLLNVAYLLHVCFLAKLLQASAEAVVLVAEVAGDHGLGAMALLIDLVETGITAGVFYYAADSFRRVITVPGRDIPHILEALGGSDSLMALFEKLAHVARVMAVITVLQALLPLTQHLLEIHVSHGIAHAWDHAVHLGLHLLAMMR